MNIIRFIITKWASFIVTKLGNPYFCFTSKSEGKWTYFVLSDYICFLISVTVLFIHTSIS